ncbi:hypothetical protein JYB87_01015 [Shewanella avicenniae]|uniref:Uncharacterized protein n=1 Tax=Shewanella avicenniae TaxID=2814294 RepID=A0ABX7QSD8_9GAMM|nr:hypothetical protein [Shewanella avicenniae]QSX33866.1 hypothetical protein JYB87_01015 [Shewanella avicenniae]
MAIAVSERVDLVVDLLVADQLLMDKLFKISKLNFGLISALLGGTWCLFLNASKCQGFPTAGLNLSPAPFLALCRVAAFFLASLAVFYRLAAF